MDFLNPALEALTPSINNDPTEIKISTAPQKASRKRTCISAQDDSTSTSVPTPKTNKKNANPKRRKKAAKKPIQEAPKAPKATKGTKDKSASNGDNEDEDGADSKLEDAKKVRAANYLEHEDLHICTSWLEMTEDGLKGTDQTGTAFWDTQSLNKFNGCVNQINHRNPSGTTATNRISMAFTLYTKLHDKSFGFMCCYNLLSKALKWHNYIASLAKKNKAKVERKGAPNPSSPSSSLLPSSTRDGTTNSTLDTSGDKTACGGPTCPIGFKKAKVAYQEEKLDASNHKHLKKMTTAHLEIADVVKKQQTSFESAIVQEMLDAKRAYTLNSGHWEGVCMPS
ncbi:hypothetical protein PTTG_25685 [Puccinia triticina 1-1 BBBD Race 1]|uniref:NAM-associated domain-containing protein n=1 Tax=Puccinia triticina (isolate 1-1 / race 1 (BBBD)) TaxID=630390 RepID=A0A180GZA6_PUCT1|nr:hypothetical protein PTTG_25685 [Puccinia triticina 1-1 BBBD Race 1]